VTPAPPLPPALALLAWLLPGDDALLGDLLEASVGRSRFWLWRQVLLAAPARLLSALRLHPRASIETALVSTAILALLGFYAVVVASLVNHLLVLNDITWISVTGRFRDWQWLSTAPACAVAIVTGRTIGRFHHDHRVAAVVIFSASATAAAFLNLLLFVPDALLRPFVPSAALQTANSMIFIAGLFAGIGPLGGRKRESCSRRLSA
jgi:hypothetical protein